MARTKDEVLSLLDAHGVQHQVFEHAAVMTCDAQAEALSGVDAQITKNLFVRDKKRRHYVITALSGTKVDLKVLSARLGTGKGGISWGSEEQLSKLLQVEPGCVTPLAIVNAPSQSALLLLDSKLRDAGSFFVHPLVNTASARLNAEGLDAFLRGIGREPIYVDLEAEPRIDKDNPPDLKVYADALEVPPPADPSNGAPGSTPAASAAAVAAPTAAAAAAAAAAPTAGAQKAGKGGSSKPSSKAPAPATALSDELKHVAATDVTARTRELLDKVAMALVGKPFAEAQLDAYASERLQADVEAQLNSFKNAAYTLGFAGATEKVVAQATKRWA